MDVGIGAPSRASVATMLVPIDVFDLERGLESRGLGIGRCKGAADERKLKHQPIAGHPN
jgi:hypothetical protein